MWLFRIEFLRHQNNEKKMVNILMAIYVRKPIWNVEMSVSIQSFYVIKISRKRDWQDIYLAHILLTVCFHLAFYFNFREVVEVYAKHFEIFLCFILSAQLIFCIIFKGIENNHALIGFKNLYVIKNKFIYNKN